MFRDECNGPVLIDQEEVVEQKLAEQYIEPSDIVLELGARYGTVSCIINRKLSNPTNQVSVEPQYQVFEALSLNKNNHRCQFHIYKGFVSKRPLVLQNYGYGASYDNGHSEEYPCMSLEDLQSKYNLQFDTLVADCEGGLQPFFEDHPFFFSQLKKVIMEKDCSDKCDYDWICNQLMNHGLKCIHSECNGFYEVYSK